MFEGGGGKQPFTPTFEPFEHVNKNDNIHKSEIQQIRQTNEH